MKKEIAAIERRVARIKRELAKVGDMRPGSLSVQTRKWGGEYCQLSYTHLGKGHTEHVPQARRKTVERQLASYQKFRKLMQEWIDLEIELCKLKLNLETENTQ
jgi:hypothetical protein